MKFVPEHHRVIVRLPIAPTLASGLPRLTRQFPGLRVVCDCVARRLELSGLRCLPYCPPGWTPRTIDLDGDQQWPETYSGCNGMQKASYAGADPVAAKIPAEQRKRRQRRT